MDNQGVVRSLVRGSSSAGDLNMAVGQVWLAIAAMGIGLFACRVESKANVADGPTRDDLALLESMNAQFRLPVLPSWVLDLWAFPAP